jgi:1,2-phenylacetyl-CoA epoxidase PaaB subunit
MTLPLQGRKLTQQELESIWIAVNETDIRAIHPEKMEAFAENMVERLKSIQENL